MKCGSQFPKKPVRMPFYRKGPPQHPQWEGGGCGSRCPGEGLGSGAGQGQGKGQSRAQAAGEGSAAAVEDVIIY